MIHFRHMKNRASHEAVLTDRALARLKLRIEFLHAKGKWAGLETPVLLGASGKPLSAVGVNRMLKTSAALAAIRRNVSTHVLRKSVGTLIGRYNPRYAIEQLDITPRVFEAHYNQPTVDDRLLRKDLLPGSNWTPSTPEEHVGKAWLKRVRGEISEREFQETLRHARAIAAPRSPTIPEVSPYG